jgi:hypothetical protein
MRVPIRLEARAWLRSRDRAIWRHRLSRRVLEGRKRPIVRSIATACCAIAVFGAAPAIAERRVALVIGNGAYSKVGKLANPARDAAAVAALLRTAGFEAVEVRTELGLAAMRRALSDFADQAAGADIAVDGDNYLIPVDAALERDIHLKDETIPLERVTEIMEGARRLRLVILDACRDNPFVRTMRRSGRRKVVRRAIASQQPVTARISASGTLQPSPSRGPAEVVRKPTFAARRE